jgi:hypothetical protein
MKPGGRVLLDHQAQSKAFADAFPEIANQALEDRSDTVTR